MAGRASWSPRGVGPEVLLAILGRGPDLPMTEAAEFIDAALRFESSWERAETDRSRIGGDLQFYGTSVGAVRGTVRDALVRYRGLDHDSVLALSSELWSAAVFERRLAAIVLLQSRVQLIRNSDLTRIEGFLREAGTGALADPLVLDVLLPAFAGWDDLSRARGESVLTRWSRDPDPRLRAAAAALAER